MLQKQDKKPKPLFFIDSFILLHFAQQLTKKYRSSQVESGKTRLTDRYHETNRVFSVNIPPLKVPAPPLSGLTDCHGLCGLLMMS